MTKRPAIGGIHPLQPIFTAHLFPKVDGMLLELLHVLSTEDWEKQTVSPKWKVRDVAAHLLDTALRGVSFGRDGYFAAGSEYRFSRRIGYLYRSPQ